MIKDTVILVVGASSGIGAETAKLLAQRGAHVGAAARRIERLLRLRADFADQGLKIAIFECDAAQPVQVDSAIQELIHRYGRLDTLVFAAGTNLPARTLSELSTDNWQRLIDTNLTAAFHCTQAAVARMRTQHGGLIIYLSTGAVQSPDLSGVACQASKHGLTGLAQATRQEEKQHGIRTTLIFPGLCDTEILKQRPVPTPPETLQQALRPSDVAEAVAFVCDLDPRCHVPELQILPAGL